MTRITEDLIRKRAEHNNCELSTLEEVSLHQQDIERIEYFDKWCRQLKILYLQSNLIPKIEHVSKLKKLEYLNLALNNVERVENLEGCESLKKLDLTVNFVGELTSIENLKDLHHFEDFYLTGNPCTEFDGYRDYVIATLPQLKKLDGKSIERSERIQAIQNYESIRESILNQQEKYIKKREREKADSQKKEKKSVKETGFDGRWYTDINNCSQDSEDKTTDKRLGNGDNEETAEDKDSEFWQEKVPFTPESRVEVHEHMKKQREREKEIDKAPVKRERRLITDDGKPLNVNEAKIDFSLTEDDENSAFVLDVATYKFIDTSLLDVDVQTTYVKVTIKGKVFQLVLPEEVNPDKSSAKRSQTTGHLMIAMPKANVVIKSAKSSKKFLKEANMPKEVELPSGQQEIKRTDTLEVDPSKASKVDYSNIVSEKKTVPPLGHREILNKGEERANSDDFVDDPDVPPLV